MFYAKAIYQGGKIIAADEDLNYSSYTELGLRCIFCGEEVNLRKGSVRSPHFAHFMDVGSSPSNCPLRVRGFSDSWSELTVESKGQRRKLFQEHFLSIIKKVNPNFDNYIQKLQNSNYIRNLDDFVNKCSAFFRMQKINLMNECRSLALKNSNHNLIMQFLISSEAIDYLSISSSEQLLEQLIYYSFYLCYSELSLDIKDNFISEKQTIKIVKKIKNIILETDWLSNFKYFIQEIQVSSGDASRLPSPVDALTKRILKSIETYLDINVNGQIITYKKYTTVKLKFIQNKIFLYTMQIVGRVGTVEKENYRYFKTLAHITNIELISNDSNEQEIVISLKLVYSEADKDIINLYPDDGGFTNFLEKKIIEFMKEILSIKMQYTYKYKKINFNLDTK